MEAKTIQQKIEPDFSVFADISWINEFVIFVSHNFSWFTAAFITVSSEDIVNKFLFVISVLQIREMV